MHKAGLPLVSVVVPIRNRARFLVPTLESILQQDYPNIECIVVDGASTDGTVD
ncbi:MAG: glycosyltransferase, partial [Dehalococcoidia bacterium]